MGWAMPDEDDADGDEYAATLDCDHSDSESTVVVKTRVMLAMIRIVNQELGVQR